MKSNTARMKPSWETPTDLSGDAVVEISGSLRKLLADVFALYLKTKNFHWHMSGKHFRDYHLLLDEQADQIFAMTDEIAERARKLGGSTIRSISDIARASTIERQQRRVRTASGHADRASRRQPAAHARAARRLMSCASNTTTSPPPA